MPTQDRSEPQDGPHRGKIMHVRIDADLFLAAMKKARRYGGISPVIRAMLRRFVASQDLNFDITDLEEENTPAERPGRPRKVSGKGVVK
jgi:antitoxin component of RelBE/YafQ-DinJ toxin-antitoxin module